MREWGAQLPPVLHRALAMEDLTFRYGAGRAPLSDVSAMPLRLYLIEINCRIAPSFLKAFFIH